MLNKFMERVNSKTIGDLAELEVACDLAKQGYIVSRPLSDNATYDLIADINGRLLRVQVKARAERNNAVAVELRSCMRNYVYMYEKSDWDILAVYNIKNGKLAYLTWDNIGDNGTVVLRVQPPKNNQIKGVRMFEDFSRVAQR